MLEVAKTIAFFMGLSMGVIMAILYEMLRHRDAGTKPGPRAESESHGAFPKASPQFRQEKVPGVGIGQYSKTAESTTTIYGMQSVEFDLSPHLAQAIIIYLTTLVPPSTDKHISWSNVKWVLVNPITLKILYFIKPEGSAAAPKPPGRKW